MTKDEIVLLQRYREIKHHGEGKLEALIGPYGQDKTKVRVVAGKAHTFIIDRYIEDWDAKFY